MLGALIIVFREAIEAGLIVGIMLAVTSGVPARGRWIGAGVAAGVVGSCVVAAFADALSRAMAGAGQELFNAGILALAVVMLAWHNIWMARHGKELAAHFGEVGRAVREGASTLGALAIVVGVAVLREGSEVALFLYGLALSGGDTLPQLLLGAALGLALGCALSALTFFGLVKIPPRRLFMVTSVLIAFLAAGLAAQCVAFLQQAGMANILEATAWDTSWALSDSSLPGKVLRTLIGYSDQPSILQALVYAATLALIFALTKLAKAPARTA